MILASKCKKIILIIKGEGEFENSCEKKDLNRMAFPFAYPR
jgi:hypothetical protein